MDQTTELLVSRGQEPQEGSTRPDKVVANRHREVTSSRAIGGGSGLAVVA